MDARSVKSDGVQLELPSSHPAKADGRACLTFHEININNGEMVSNMNMAFTGRVSSDGDEALFKVARQLPSSSFKSGISELISTYQFIQESGKRLEAEAARRGQPIPIVRKLG